MKRILEVETEYGKFRRSSHIRYKNLCLIVRFAESGQRVKVVEVMWTTKEGEEAKRSARTRNPWFFKPDLTCEYRIFLYPAPDPEFVGTCEICGRKKVEVRQIQCERDRWVRMCADCRIIDAGTNEVLVSWNKPYSPQEGK